MRLAVTFLCFWPAAFAFGGDIAPGRVLTFGRPTMTQVSSRVFQEFKPHKIVGVSQTRALALFEERTSERISPTPTPSVLKTGDFSVEFAQFKEQQRGVLAFLNREGKVVSRTEVDAEGGGEKGRWEDAHLLSIEADACPYAVIPPDRPKLFCFDWQLNTLASYKIPPAVYTGVAPVFTTEGLEVWLFPKAGSGPKGERTTPAYHASIMEPVPNLEVVGFRLKIPAGEVQPLAVDASELVRRLQLLANKGREEPLQLQPGSVRILPTKLAPTVPPVRVVITVVASSSFENEVHFTGERLFFLAELGEREVGKLKPLPFRLRQGDGKEEGVNREDAFDEKSGIYYLPTAFVKPWVVQAFEGRNGHVAVFCNLLAKTEEEYKAGKVGKPRLVTGLVFFLVSEKERVRKVGIVDVAEAVQKLASDRSRISVFPVLLGKFGSSEFVFAADCGEETQESSERCAVTVDLGF